MGTVIKTILVATSSTLAVKLNKYFMSQGFNDGISLLLSAVIASVAYHLLTHVVIELPMQFRLLRRFLDRRAQLEGIYIEERLVNCDRPISVSRITYDPENKSYGYWGHSYSNDGQLQATWGARDISIEGGNSIVRYFFDAEIMLEPPQCVRGFGVLEMNNGTGFFVDSGTGVEKHFHSIRKVSDKIVDASEWVDLAKQHRSKQ